jgi:hypothetical protein
MDQAFDLRDRGLAVERLRDFVAASVNEAPAFNAPFYHLVLDRVFPDDIYAAMLNNMPDATDYRPMHGRAKAHDLADGTRTRVKIDLDCLDGLMTSWLKPLQAAQTYKVLNVNPVIVVAPC